MIKKIDNFNLDNANKIWHIFQNSYAVEANILKVDDFPPLKEVLLRLLNQIIIFLHLRYSDLVALIEIDIKAKIHIQSLVVSPDHFRKGYAKKLVKYLVLSMFDSHVFMVETGFDNLPAKNLYSSLGFAEMLQI